MAGSHNQTENIIQAINLTQKLRTSVGKVFDNLGDGFEIGQGNEKALLNTFQQSLLDVNNDFSELEKISSSLQPVSSTNPPNSIYLSIDPAIDKTPVYSQILQAYKWSNKISELAGHAVSLLDQHMKIKQSMTMGVSMQAKRMKRIPPTGHATHPNAVDNFIARMSQKTVDMTISVTRPLGSCAVLQITLGKVLKAQVALRGTIIEWVNVRGFSEENPDESKLELWTKSRYEVFRKVTESATAATLHFYLPHNSELALHSFILWFQSYRTLFSAPCVKCGKHYLAGCPPTWRDLRTTEAYHDICK